MSAEIWVFYDSPSTPNSRPIPIPDNCRHVADFIQEIQRNFPQTLSTFDPASISLHKTPDSDSIPHRTTIQKLLTQIDLNNDLLVKVASAVPATSSAAEPVVPDGGDVARDPGNTLDAFEMEYNNPLCLDEYVSRLKNYCKDWRRMHYLAPYHTLVQSSGYGKSRLVKELSRQTGSFVMSICLRTDPGAPRRSAIATMVEQAASYRDYGSEQLCSFMFFVHLIIASAGELKEFKDNPGVYLRTLFVNALVELPKGSYRLSTEGKLITSENGPIKIDGEVSVEPADTSTVWYDIQQVSEEGTELSGNAFWTKVKHRMHTLDKDEANRSKQLPYKKSDAEVCTALEGALADGTYLFFFLDEARVLVEQKAGHHFMLLRCFRYAMASVPDGANTFFVLTDTLAKISNYSPAQSKLKTQIGPSARPKAGTHLYPPFYELDTTDRVGAAEVFRVLQPQKAFDTQDAVYAEMGSLMQNYMERQDVESLHMLHCVLLAMGRPLWGAYIVQQIKDNTKLGMVASNVLYFAKQKLTLNSEEKFSKSSYSEAAALAVLQARYSLYLLPRLEIAAELTASHMATILHFSPKNSNLDLTVDYASEPVVHTAAAQVLRMSGDETNEEETTILLQHLRHGMVGAMTKGEHVSKVLILKALDMCHVNASVSDSVLVTPVTVSTFLDALLDQELWKKALKDQVDVTASEK